MAEIIKSVGEDVNEDVREDEVAESPVVPEVQTAVEENPADKTDVINPDGTSTADTAVIADAEKVAPVVENNLNEVSEKAPESDYRLNNKYGAKTAEGETVMNSDLNYQSLFGMPTK